MGGIAQGLVEFMLNTLAPLFAALFVFAALWMFIGELKKRPEQRSHDPKGGFNRAWQFLLAGLLLGSLRMFAEDINRTLFYKDEAPVVGGIRSLEEEWSDADDVVPFGVRKPDWPRRTEPADDGGDDDGEGDGG